jgi:hypothetical protein
VSGNLGQRRAFAKTGFILLGQFAKLPYVEWLLGAEHQA